jgi:hypothetical protein
MRTQHDHDIATEIGVPSRPSLSGSATCRRAIEAPHRPQRRPHPFREAKLTQSRVDAKHRAHRLVERRSRCRGCALRRRGTKRGEPFIRGRPAMFGSCSGSDVLRDRRGAPESRATCIKVSTLRRGTWSEVTGIRSSVPVPTEPSPTEIREQARVRVRIRDIPARRRTDRSWVS